MANTEKYTFFFNIHSPFSQWHPAKFDIEEMEFNCAEQYFMYIKALTFGDKELATKIMDTPNPKLQKALGRRVRNFDKFTWKTKCCQGVKAGNFAKVSTL